MPWISLQKGIPTFISLQKGNIHSPFQCFPRERNETSMQTYVHSASEYVTTNQTQVGNYPHPPSYRFSPTGNCCNLPPNGVRCGSRQRVLPHHDLPDTVRSTSGFPLHSSWANQGRLFKARRTGGISAVHQGAKIHQRRVIRECFVDDRRRRKNFPKHCRAISFSCIETQRSRLEVEHEGRLYWSQSNMYQGGRVLWRAFRI